MTQPKPQTETELAGWRAGQRVSRKDTEELGTIVEANGKITVEMGRRARTLTGFSPDGPDLDFAVAQLETGVAINPLCSLLYVRFGTIAPIPE